MINISPKILNSSYDITSLDTPMMRVSECEAITKSIIFQNKTLLVIIALLILYILIPHIKNILRKLKIKN